MTEKSWLAAYLYCAEPWETILSQAVKPFVAGMLDQGWAESYFFIRYWERGPHIRLRFYGDTQAMDREIRPRLDDHFQKWFAQNPTTVEVPEWVTDQPADQQWFPNDSIQYITYEPETARYGGPVGLPIGERQFRISSDAILDVISESGDWGYERALGVAIQMHLGFAHAFGMDLKMLQAFYRCVSSGWLPRAYNFNEETTPEEHGKNQAAILKTFEETFMQQKDMLLGFCQTLWEALQEDVEFEQEWVNTYIRDLKGIKADLEAHAGDIVCRDLFFKDHIKDLDPEKTRLWPILESYIHMTNNRLGVLNRDEAFLGYLIEKTTAHF